MDDGRHGANPELLPAGQEKTDGTADGGRHGYQHKPEPPRGIRMHENDNVAIVVNGLGLPAGTEFPSGPMLRERVPQGHKVALADIADGAPCGAMT